MRVALLSCNAPRHNAVGNLLAEKVRFFQEHGAEVRLFVEDARDLHPALTSCLHDGPVAEFLAQADLVLAVYGQYYDLLQQLPLLAGTSTRIVVEYLGVTPPQLWPDQHREGLQVTLQQRGYVWCADHVLAISDFARRELQDATRFPLERATVLPLPVDTQQFRPEPRERFLQERLGIDGRFLLYVGRLAGNKRVPLLIEALARLDDPALHAVIIGDRSDVYAEEARRCDALAQRLGVSARLHWLGQLADADLPRAYRSAAVFVMPSLHEGQCLPVLEAMACGLPVVASRSTALPETIAAAGLTFTPDDADDLTRQLRRVLGNAACGFANAKPQAARRVAVVSFRFGPDIVGGAETSLRTMARALQDAGQHIEVFTTCTKTESHWQNDVPAGSLLLEELRVHRFAIDAHDAIAHGETYRLILEAQGRVAPPIEQRYLQQSLHSTALMRALQDRQGEFDVIITGPYLFGLTADIVSAFAEKTLVVPCFHDEALARLSVWPRLFSQAAGLLYHSAEEQRFAQEQLGVNHPNAWEAGTCLSVGQDSNPVMKATGLESCPTPYVKATGLESCPTPYLVYCGRYAEQKNVPLLVEWVTRYQREHRGRFDVVFMGQGDVALPAEPWLRNLGRVDEAAKRSVLAGAKALLQLSVHESLSIVVLEAWAQGTPVIVHEQCRVLAGQVARGQGGVAVADYASFAAALNDLWQSDAAWREDGARGRAYALGHYGSPQKYVQRLLQAMTRMQKPLREQMRERGLKHVQQFARQRWQERFGAFIEGVLTQPARAYREAMHIEPLRTAGRAPAGARTLLVPVRLTNTGTHAAAAQGPGRTVICCEVRGADSEQVMAERCVCALSALSMPGQAQVAALPVAIPENEGTYRLVFWTQRPSTMKITSSEAVLPLMVEATHQKTPSGCADVFLETVRKTLPRTQALQDLPADYVDVTEGKFAPLKRFVKRKLLNNFKRGYVDVLSRQQSQVNRELVLMMQQLSECCALLDHAVTGLHQRLDALEAKMEEVLGTEAARDPFAPTEKR